MEILQQVLNVWDVITGVLSYRWVWLFFVLSFVVFSISFFAKGASYRTAYLWRVGAIIVFVLVGIGGYFQYQTDSEHSLQNTPNDPLTIFEKDG